MERSRIWQRAFGPDSHTEHSGARDRFRVSFERSRDFALVLSGEIAGTLPNFTRHDSQHIDTLWEIADIIVGDYPLNPAEAYVLGMSFLVHDLAMSNAVDELLGKPSEKDVQWRDEYGIAFRDKYRRAPTSRDYRHPDPEISASVAERLMRARHAEKAHSLPGLGWRRLRPSKQFFIEDADLRFAYGDEIGVIAESHHWSMDRVAETFAQPRGAIGFAPSSWTVDSFLVACVLRVADAAHLDAPRAPDILAAARNIAAESQPYWIFQQKMDRPFPDDDRLVFRSTAFTSTEIEAWWVGYDALNVVDRELKNVDAALRGRGRPRFAIRSVANVQSPQIAKMSLRVSGWEPIDARVHVSNVTELVHRFGGRALYGDEPATALRELISNATDACRARRYLGDYSSGLEPRVRVYVRKNADGSTLHIEDNGIGMTKDVLTTGLLDFGNTSWLSAPVLAENPGLAASGFSASGQYGIGFFSAFMLGLRVIVASRSRMAGPAETSVLEFRNGISSRAVVRRALSEEFLGEAGHPRFCHSRPRNHMEAGK